MDNREIWLATTFVALMDTLADDFDEGEYAACVAARLADLLGPAEVGLLTDDGSGRLTVAGASTDRVRALLTVEERCEEGPCTASFRTGQGILNQSLDTADDRWPQYAPTARLAGFGMATALIMRRRGDVLGAVCVLDTGDRALPEQDVHLAQLLADAATVGLLNHRALRESTRTSEQLQHALHSRVLIEQAKGVVAARLDIAPDAAFELLRGYARRHNRKLIQVAGDTVRSALPVTALTAVRRTQRKPG